MSRQKPKRRPVPSILQVEVVECGAACLAMILASFGAWIPLEQLRTACGVSRDGSKASNILKSARHYGLAAKGYRKEPNDLADLPWPLIIHWNFNHYVVFEGMSKDRIYLNDPALGPRIVSRQEFDESFTGVALAFELTDQFKKTARPPGLLSAYRSRIGTSHAALTLIALLSVIAILPGLVLPVFSKMFVDGILLAQQEHWVMPLLLGMVATALVRAGLTGLRQDLLLRFKSKLIVAGASRFMWRTLHLPMSFFSQRSPGEIAGRVDASTRVAQGLAGDVSDSFIDMGSTIFFGLMMIAFDPMLGLVAVLLAAPNAIVMRSVQSSLARNSRSLASETGKLGAQTAGLIINIETLKASGLENATFANWAGQHAKVLDTTRRIGVESLTTNLAPVFMRGVIHVVILGLGAWRIMSGAMTVGDLVAFQSLTESFSEPLRRLVDLGPKLNAVKADLARVEDALRNAPDPLTQLQPDEDARRSPWRGEIVVENLNFGYNPLETPLVEDFSLQILPGQRVALVGRSGCGKSTLGRLISGLLQPSSGTIYLDQRPLNELDPRSRATAIAAVDQEIFLFEGTVRENLTLWNPEVTDDVLTRALADAELLDDITSRPGELDAIVEEAGRNFSGGQRQRLEIARALVGNPSVLILDEATAALDPQTEKVIDENLRRRGCTCIIIAHRLSTIRDCSEIIVMEAGKIVERGTHDALMDKRGVYADLIKSA